MSQAGPLENNGSGPQEPIEFVADVGTAMTIANIVEILGNAVAAHSVPLQTTASGNTVNIDVQYASAAPTSVASNAGVASFNSNDFSVDSNGFVTMLGNIATESFMVDAFTFPGTNPVVPNGSGIVTITGGQVGHGVIGANVIRTDSLAANTYTIEIQRSTTTASADSTKNGVAHFNVGQFDVDNNGFVSILGGGFSWVDVTGTTQTIAVETGYVADNAGLVTFTLPATAAFGAVFRIVGQGAGGWTLVFNAGQKVVMGSSTATTTSGSLSSTNQADCIECVCTTLNNVFTVMSSMGNITIV